MCCVVDENRLTTCHIGNKANNINIESPFKNTNLNLLKIINNSFHYNHLELEISSFTVVYFHTVN